MNEQVPSKERDLSEYLGKDRDELRAIIGERDAEIEQLREARHKNDRVNFETTDDGFRICRGYHHRSADCEWLYYVPRSTPEPSVGRGEPSGCTCRYVDGGDLPARHDDDCHALTKPAAPWCEACQGEHVPGDPGWCGQPKEVKP